MIAAHRARLIPALAVLAALLLPLLPASAETSEKIHLPKAAALSADELRDAIGDAAQARDPVVLSLMSDLEMFKANQAERDEARRKAYEETMAKMAEDLKNGKLEDALIDAIEANGLADDPKAMLLNEKVLELVARCEDQAKAAEKEGNWIEALHLYRALNLLFENQYRYDKPVDRCEQRVRLLRYYAPKELKRLLGERAKKLGKPVDESDDIKLDSWKQTHKDVELSMYRQALRHVAANHISNTSYNELLLASIDAMQRFVETEPIKATFPVLGDASKVRAFKTALDDIRVAVVKKGDDLNFLDMHLLVDRIRRANDEIIELPEAVLTYELTNGATGILDDFSTVIWPSELETFSRSTQGKFYGVGIQISRRDGRLVVVTPLPNTPAFDAGVKAGDIIAEVNGENTDAWSLDRAVREITGPEGTEVNLGIERVGHKELIPLAVTRAEIVIESVKGWDHDEKGEWDFYIDREAKIGYIRLSQFIPQSVEHIDEAIKQMERDNGLEGLIIDLRFNPGGLLSSAIDITDRFISAGPIVSTQGRDGRTEHEVRATESATFRSFPIGDCLRRRAGLAPRRDRRRAHVRQGLGTGPLQAQRWAGVPEADHAVLPSAQETDYPPHARRQVLGRGAGRRSAHDPTADCRQH